MNDYLLTNKLGKIKAVFDDSKIYCDQTNRVLVKYTDLKNIENKSIKNSIKKFSDKNRKELELISKQFDLKYILALLNSKLYLFLFDLLRTKESFDLNPLLLRKLPVSRLPITEQQQFIEIVDEIIEAKKQNPNADTGKLECKIDELVYQLYGLTDEEIRIVEGKA